MKQLTDGKPPIIEVTPDMVTDPQPLGRKRVTLEDACAYTPGGSRWSGMPQVEEFEGYPSTSGATTLASATVTISDDFIATLLSGGLVDWSEYHRERGWEDPE